MTDFDQDLYDRVMAKYSPVSVREGHELYEEGRRAGYHQATVEAARISADRLTRAQVIEELANSADAAIMAGVFGRMPLADWLRSQK
jgi:hypothetical protein